MSKPLITILGPTASGKTKVAVGLAARIGGEIISADSRQVYRDMNIGTGKDIEEYTIDGQSIPVHLIDIRDAGYKYNVFEYQADFTTAMEQIESTGVRPILCGGTGQYIDAVLKGGYPLVGIPSDGAYQLQMEAMDRQVLINKFVALPNPIELSPDLKAKKRIARAIQILEYLQQNPNHKIPKYAPVKHVLFGIKISREERRAKISKRLLERLDNGMIEEVEALVAKGISLDDLKYYGLEYKFITQFLNKEMSRAVMTERLEIAIHQFAKRQMTWFRKMEKDGYQINWIDGAEAVDEILSFL